MKEKNLGPKFDIYLCCSLLVCFLEHENTQYKQNIVQ